MESPVVRHGDKEAGRKPGVEDRRGHVGSVALVGGNGDHLDQLVVVRIAGLAFAFEDAEGVALLVGDQDIAGAVVDRVDRDALVLVGETVGAAETRLALARLELDRGRIGLSMKAVAK